MICNNIEAYYLNLKAGRTDAIRKTYLSRLYRLNERNKFESNGEVFEGTIINVEDNGLLVVATADGNKTYNLKEIAFLNK